MNNAINQAREIFLKAIEAHSRTERAEFVATACCGDENLRLRVERLLRSHELLGPFQAGATPATGSNLSFFFDESLGSTIGPYKLIEQIGDGGMGVVYLAAQKEPVRRMVALKVIKAGMDTQQVVARFEAERQAMAMMNHPNIAKVLDGGATGAGRPYFVMELVKGAPITEFCDSHKLDTKRRLRLFIAVCQAIQHAHQKGLIHRDIKPSNVMVEMHDVTPVPKVIDFGVAKAIGHQLTEKTLHSGFHQMVGTPLYMSPEQAGQSSIDIDTRSDIYSLGVLLDEILTGQTPFESEALRTAGYDEMRRMIREVDPPRPSARVSTLEAKVLSTVSDCRNIDARKFSDQLRGELDWIVMKALEKDRSRRYDTANEFADDVQRFLNDEAVLACPPSTFYRFRKLASRNRASLSAATLVAATLVVGTAISVWQAMQARDAKAQTEIAKQQLDERYRIAKEAVDTYLLRVTQDERLDHPSFRQLRQSLLEAALPYYDQLHAISPTDEQSQAAFAETLNQLGGVKQELGRFDESLEAFEQAATLFDHLASDHPRQLLYRQSLAKVLVNLADHYRTRGATSESLDYEQSALALRQQLVADHPDIDLLQLELAQSYTNVGVGTQESDGRDLLERAIEIWQGFADRFPEQSLYREYLSLGYQNLAHRFAWDQAEEAIPFHEFAIDLQEQLAREQPESKKSHIQWAQSHQYLAETLEKLSPRLVEARQHHDESIGILQAYSKKYPQWPEVKSHLATSQNKLAHTLKELGELESAQETCETALRQWEQLLSEYPDMLAYEVGLATAQHNAGSIVVAKGQAVEGMSMLTQSRDRLLKILDRIGPHDRSNELLRTITSALTDTRKSLGQGRDQSLEEAPERKTQMAGEALRPSKFLTDLSNSPTQSLRVGGMAFSLPQTEEQEQSMKRLRSKMSRSASSSTIRNNRTLAIEPLEGRQLLASLISASDATIDEIGGPSAFVTAGSGGLQAPVGVTLGPDGNLYAVGNSAIRRYNGLTGQYIDTFVSQGSGGLSDAFGVAFGPDGNLYVSSGANDSILRYNGTTGAFINAFVSTGLGGLDHPKGITFGSDNNLYVSSQQTNSILRFQGPLSAGPGSPLPAIGQSGATFVSSNSGLLLPISPIFGDDGNLYVSGNQAGVMRFNGSTGQPLGTFVPKGHGDLTFSRGIAFDREGRLYVGDSADGVHVYDSQGQFIGDLLVNSVSYNIARPWGLAFDSQGRLLITSNSANAVMRYDRGVAVTLSAANSTQTTTVNYTTSDGTASAGTDYVSFSGQVTFLPGETTRYVLLAAKDDLEFDAGESYVVQLASPSAGSTILDGEATVTILDEDQSRQFSVLDATATEGDRSVHYRGAFVQTIPGSGFNYLETGPDGNLYVGMGAGPRGDTISRYNGTTGEFMDVFASPTVSGTRGIAFRDDSPIVGDEWMFVGNEDTDQVFRFNASNGAFVDTFVTERSGGIDGVHGLTTGPDMNGDGIRELYVVGRNSGNVYRYDGANGNPLGSFTTSGSGSLSWPEGITIDGSGVAYVASGGTNKIQKYSASTGVFLGSIGGSELSGPHSTTLGSDGLLYVTSGGNNRILRYTTNGQFVDDFVPAGSGGMVRPCRLEFGTNGDLYVTTVGFYPAMNQIFRFGTQNEAVVTVAISTPSTVPLKVDFTTANSSALSGSDFSATIGSVTFEPGVTSKVIRVPILDDTPATTEPTETFFVNISLNSLNPQAGTIADGQAVASILDNDPFTKFYVVNDATTTATPDGTYEYGSTGSSIENYALSGGNTSPRGAASTTLGTTVWVVDANKSVYAYNTSGVLQGSWAAGGLQSTAQLEGIATNGTDVWLVDRTADKVYRYTNAASRTGGSQNAFSSFSLNSGNKNPKDIVTDGNYLWVVDDSTTDKVFKYTIGGTYVGSWRISTSGPKNPTGITLDPSNPAHIWIVDSGTDRVYQYDNSVGLTSGSKSANSNWALAAGNTNPQGIADPPPPSVSLNAAHTTSVVNNDSSVANPIARDLMQAPVAWLGVHSADSLVPIQPKQSVLLDSKKVDKTILQLASLLPAAPHTSIKALSTPVLPLTRIAEAHSVDLAFADEELFDSLHTAASHRLESTIS